MIFGPLSGGHRPVDGGYGAHLASHLPAGHRSSDRPVGVAGKPLSPITPSAGEVIIVNQPWPEMVVTGINSHSARSAMAFRLGVIGPAPAMIIVSGRRSDRPPFFSSSSRAPPRAVGG